MHWYLQALPYKLRPPQAAIALPSIKDTFSRFLWLTDRQTTLAMFDSCYHSSLMLFQIKSHLIVWLLMKIRYVSWKELGARTGQWLVQRTLYFVRRANSSLFSSELQGSGIGKDPGYFNAIISFSSAFSTTMLLLCFSINVYFIRHVHIWNYRELLG